MLQIFAYVLRDLEESRTNEEAIFQYHMFVKNFLLKIEVLQEE